MMASGERRLAWVEPMRRFRHWMADSLLTFNRLVSSDRLSRHGHDASALVFAPHPDDEVLGCGGIISLKVQARARIEVVIMTDGRASHRSHIAEDELVRIRRAEAEMASRQLGLDAKYVFLDFEDHRLGHYRDAACDRVVEIIDRFRPEEIYLPHRRDVLGDHVETNRIVRRAVALVGRPVVLLEYPVWLWNGWPWTPGGARHASGRLQRVLGAVRDMAEIVLACRTRIDVSSVLHRKLSALAAYRSQLQRLNDDPRWPVLSDVAEGEFLRRFESDIELFRRTRFRA